MLCFFVFGQNAIAQTDSLAVDILKAKLELDNKVSLSKNYLKVSGYTINFSDNKLSLKDPVSST